MDQYIGKLLDNRYEILELVGTGGMATKLEAAKIATGAGADMVIANGKDFHIIHRIMEGKKEGTLFLADPKEEFYLIDYIDQLVNP